MTKQSTNIDVKRANRVLCYRAILGSDTLSKQDIARQLAVSLPTVAQNIRELAAQGLVEETGEFASTGGRKAKAVAAVAEARIALGLDITQNHVGLVALDLRGNLLRHIRVQKRFDHHAHYYAETGVLAADFVRMLGKPFGAVLGVGIAVPGIVSQDRNTILDSHVPGIPRRTGNEFATHLPWPSSLCNDANAAGLAETWGSDSQNLQVLLSLSNTVGGAILDRAGFYPGDNQRSAEFGHISIQQGGKRCYCGREGCFDAYCSALVLSSAAGGRLEDFFAALDWDVRFHAMFEEYLDRLAFMVNNLRMTFDCDVILGGYVGSYLEPFLPRLRQKVLALSTFDSDADYVRPCRYKVEASAVGSALGYIQAFIEMV